MIERLCKAYHNPSEHWQTCRLCYHSLFTPEMQKAFGEAPVLSGQRVDVEKLAGQQGRPRFNASWIRYQGKLLLAYRTGWQGAMVRLSVMNEDMTPQANYTLAPLRHARASYGREDPRLFIYRDRLHVSYTGTELTSKGIVTNVLYARLNDRLGVEKVFYPHYESRQPWEKNWVFFQSGDDLYCVYSINPHTILKVDGEKIVDVYETPCTHPWSGGYQRGGCSPVIFGGSLVHWFHGAWDLGDAWPTRQYNVGAYRFAPEPPFAIRSMTPHPVLLANLDSRPSDQYCAALFPGGAMFEGGAWRVVAGVHDRWIETFTLPPDAHLGGVPAMTTAPIRHPLPCIHLGDVVKKESCSCRRRDTRMCNAGHGEVSQAITCESCSDYFAEELDTP